MAFESASAQVDLTYLTDIANPVVDTNGVFHGNDGNPQYSHGNTVGGYVAYNTAWSMGGGNFGAYDHACISTSSAPGTPNDRANCSLQFAGSDVLTLKSNTLAQGTHVTLDICVEGSELGVQEIHQTFYKGSKLGQHLRLPAFTAVKVQNASRAGSSQSTLCKPTVAP